MGNADLLVGGVRGVSENVERQEPLGEAGTWCGPGEAAVSGRGL